MRKTPRPKSICGNCGATTGPVERVVYGTRTRPLVLILCAHGPLDEKKEHGLGTVACLKRRDTQDTVRWGGRGYR